GLMFYYGIAPTPKIFLLPPLIVLATLAALGVGTLLAALNVAYRDFRYVIPFLVQLWLFATPSVYMQTSDPPPAAAMEQKASAESAGEEASAESAGGEPVLSTIKRFLNLNPMTGLIAFFRAALLGGTLPWQQLALSVGIIMVVFLVGCFYFRRVEDSFADII